MMLEIGYDSYGVPMLLGANAEADGLTCPCGWSTTWDRVIPIEHADRHCSAHAYGTHTAQERADLGGNPAPVVPPTLGDIAREMVARQPTCKHESQPYTLATIGSETVRRFCPDCGIELPVDEECRAAMREAGEAMTEARLTEIRERLTRSRAVAVARPVGPLEADYIHDVEFLLDLLNERSA